MKNDAYIEAASKAMLTFQMVEEALKICIGLSYQIIQSTAPNPVQYKFNSKSINNAPMGKLISMYETITSNTGIVNDLRKIIEWRNFFAHNAFRHEFLERTGSSPYKQHSIDEVHRVALFSSALVESLGEEVKALQKVYKTTIGKDHDPGLTSPTYQVE
jgi:hypothetical protein